MRCALAAGLALLVSVPLASTARAQESPAASVRGLIKGIDGAPVPNAVIQHDAADSLRARSDERGLFRIAALPDGRNVFTVRALGYEPVTFAVTLGRERERVVAVELTAVAMELEGVRVEDRTGRRLLDLVGFTERERTEGSGYFLDPEDIERAGAVRVADVLRTVPGLTMRPLANGRTAFGSGRGASNLRGGGRCEPNWVVDGIPFAVAGGTTPDDMFTTQDLMAIEVYPQASMAPARFQPADQRTTARYCAVIVLWRKPEMPAGRPKKPAP
jgi:hypothetical protein